MNIYGKTDCSVRTVCLHWWVSFSGGERNSLHSRSMWGESRKKENKCIIYLPRFLPAFPFFLNHGTTAPSGPGSPHYRGFMIILRHITISRTPLDEWSACRRDLDVTTHNSQKRQTSVPLVGFEPTIPASEYPQTHALDRVATGIGPRMCWRHIS